MTVRTTLSRTFGPLRQDLWIYVVSGGLLLLLPGLFGLYREPSWLLSTFYVVGGLLVFCGVPTNLIYRHLGDRLIGDRSPLHPRALTFHAVVLPSCIVIGGFVTVILLESLGVDFPYEELRLTGPLLGIVIAGSVVAVSITVDHLKGRLRELELRELRARQESVMAQLQAIQSRVQPHFLFNCLNTVASLIQENPRQAEEAVERLADLLRYTLHSSKLPTATLGEEVDAVKGFLALEALRFGDRIKATVHVEPGLAELRVPPLVLQPIVENAIRHGIAHRREGGRLEVRIMRSGDGIVLEVEDDGPGPGGSLHQGTRTALEDLRRRLALLHPDGASVTESSGALGGYAVRISLPDAGLGAGHREVVR